jgi:hypothetical protein
MSLNPRTHHIGMSRRVPSVARAEIATDQNSQLCTPQPKIIEEPAYAPTAAACFLAAASHAEGQFWLNR